MTTSHGDEGPDAVAFFFVSLTDFHQHEFDEYLVLHIGDGEHRQDVDVAVRRYALGDQPLIRGRDVLPD